jgi:putative DNA primase/helicase
MFDETEPWSEEVNGSKLLDDMIELIQRYVDASSAIYETAALWALFTHVFDCFFTLPILLLISPAKRSGKTTLLQVLGSMVASPLMASSISAAALFRAIEEFKPTLLIDEADSFLTDNEDLRNVLNSGHTRSTAKVVRCDEKLNIKLFSTFAPKVIAMIGKPHDTILDRSIVLSMKRPKDGMRLEYLRADRLAELGASLRSKAARFALDNADILTEADPDIPVEITNARARDNWRSLLAVADVCGDKWPTLARAAAKELSGSDNFDNESQIEMLLLDIKEVFAAKKAERLFSKDLISGLIAMSDRPWPEANNGRAITPTWLSRRLRPFGIIAKSMRIELDNAKGYESSTFEDVFSRYLPVQSDSSRHNVTSCLDTDENGNPNRHKQIDCVALVGHESRINVGLCQRDGSQEDKQRCEPVFEEKWRQEAWESWEDAGAPKLAPKMKSK